MQEEEKEFNIQDIILKRKEHSKKVDMKLITKAYEYAKKYHGNQCRRSRRALYNSSN